MNFFDILYAKNHGEALSISHFDALFAKYISPAIDIWGEYDGTLPAQYSANGSTLADYRIHGASGGVGDKTVNLLDGDLITNENPGITWSKITYNLKPNTSYVLCTSAPRYAGGALLAIIGSSGSATTANNGAWDGNPRVWETDSTGVTNILFRGNNSGYDLTQYTYMLTEGSTAPTEYVPYGYVVPMSVSDGTASTTTQIYIGSDPLGEDEYVDYGEGKIYRMSGGVLTPQDPPVPLPALPTVDGTTITDFAGQSAAVPSQFYAKYRKEGF